MLIDLLEFFLPEVLWRGDSNSPEIYLTFDDGPHPIYTPQILEILRDLGVKATFFLIGERAVKNPGVVERINFEGHLIGNHSFSHGRFYLRRKGCLREEIIRTQEVIQKITGKRTNLLRPPHGRFDFFLRKVARELAHRIVMWSLDCRDYKGSISVEKITTHVGNGSILLFHDPSPGTVKALPWIVERLRCLGFRFGRLCN